MIVNLKFIGLEKIAAVLAVKQGCKGGYRPPNALGGGNGSFKVKINHKSHSGFWD